MSWSGGVYFSVQAAPPDISILAACASDIYSSFCRAAELRSVSESVGRKQKN